MSSIEQSRNDKYNHILEIIKQNKSDNKENVEYVTNNFKNITTLIVQKDSLNDIIIYMEKNNLLLQDCMKEFIFECMDYDKANTANDYRKIKTIIIDNRLHIFVLHMRRRILINAILFNITNTSYDFEHIGMDYKEE
jgi:hypothetical protein